MRTAVLLAFALTLSAVAAPLPKALKKADAELIEGAWEYVSRDDGDGQKAVAAGRDGKRPVWVVRDGKIVRMPDATDMPLRLDPTTSPKRYESEDAPGVVRKGIYKLDGDDLVCCESPAGQERPTEFQGRKSPYHYCIVYRRVKE